MKSILIVVHSQETRHQISEILSEAGYHVIAAETGEQALDLATSVPPGLVLISIVMPDLNGLQTAARLRSQPGAESIRIVLLGSIAPLGLHEEPLSFLVNGYLDVDVSPDELLACVKTHIGEATV